jgi:hypothetical protein
MTSEPTPGHPADVFVPAVASIAKIMEEVDGALLEEAQRWLSAASAAEVINQALARLIREERRLGAVASQLRRFETGEFAGPLSGSRP